jgi:nitrite reductase/ring-hydroxylating ferredoxin subunit
MLRRMAETTRVARYERHLGASLERVFENVRDWEHLPWLHRASFRSIALEEEGAFGWRARIGLAGGAEIRLELVIDGLRYVSRTLAGPGAGTEIWTTLAPRDDAHTDIAVEFLVPGIGAEAAPKLGAAYTALYTRLWDEDEAMMQRRSARLARRGTLLAPLPSDAPALDLGPVDAALARAPFEIEFAGRPFRVVRRGDALVAHSTLCPHWLGPLEAAPDAEGGVTCPWHGYRFELASGRGCGAASRLRLLPAPTIRVGPDGHAWLGVQSSRVAAASPTG